MSSLRAKEDTAVLRIPLEPGRDPAAADAPRDRGMKVAAIGKSELSKAKAELARLAERERSTSEDLRDRI